MPLGRVADQVAGFSVGAKKTIGDQSEEKIANRRTSYAIGAAWGINRDGAVWLV